MCTRATKAKGKEPSAKRSRPDTNDAGCTTGSSSDVSEHGGSVAEVSAGMANGTRSDGANVPGDVRGELRFNHQKTHHTQLKQRFNYSPWFCDY